MTSTIRLLVPVAASAAPRAERRARPPAVRRLAFLHNGQPYYDALAPDLLAALGARGELTVRSYRKPRYSSPAEPGVLDEIASGAEAAVVGLAC
jgi:hypothetical protein